MSNTEQLDITTIKAPKFEVELSPEASALYDRLRSEGAQGMKFSQSPSQAIIEPPFGLDRQMLADKMLHADFGIFRSEELNTVSIVPTYSNRIMSSRFMHSSVNGAVIVNHSTHRVLPYVAVDLTDSIRTTPIPNTHTLIPVKSAESCTVSETSHFAKSLDYGVFNSLVVADVLNNNPRSIDLIGDLRRNYKFTELPYRFGVEKKIRENVDIQSNLFAASVLSGICAIGTGMSWIFEGPPAFGPAGLGLFGLSAITAVFTRKKHNELEGLDNNKAFLNGLAEQVEETKKKWATDPSPKVTIADNASTDQMYRFNTVSTQSATTTKLTWTFPLAGAKA